MCWCLGSLVVMCCTVCGWREGWGGCGMEPAPPPAHSDFPQALCQLFCEELRPQLVASHPKASLPELSKLLAAAWRETIAEDKAAYHAMRAVRASCLRGKRGRWEGGDGAPWAV